MEYEGLWDNLARNNIWNGKLDHQHGSIHRLHWKLKKMLKENDKERLRLFNSLKNKPELALFRFVQEIKKQINEEIESLKKKAEVVIEKKIKEIISKNLLKNITQLKGNTGKDGYTPIKGKDYFTSSEINKAIRHIQSKIKVPKDGKNGIDGRTPLAGTDYLIPKDGRDGKDGKDGKNIKGDKGDPGSPDTPEDIRDKLKRLIGDERLPADAIKGLKQIQEQVNIMGGDRGRRVYPKTVSSVLGTLTEDTTDTTGATWLLPSQAKLDTEKVFVNGMRQDKGASYSYTMSNNNRKVIFNSDSIPDVDAGERILVDYEEER